MSWNKGLTKEDERVQKYVRELADHSQWKGGFTVQGGGYPSIHKSLVEEKYKGMAGKHGYILYHRYVVAKSIGKPLSSHEIVHHIDGDITNNILENLELVDRASHMMHKHPDLIKRARAERHRLKNEELSSLNDLGIISATQAAKRLGVYHSTVRRRQNRGVYSDIKSKYNGRCLYEKDIL